MKDTQQHIILVETDNASAWQCKCCNEIQVQYKNSLMTFEWTTMVTFLRKLNEAPHAEKFYIIELCNLRSVPNIQTDIFSTGLFLNNTEMKEFLFVLHTACEKVDFALIFRNTFHNN